MSKIKAYTGYNDYTNTHYYNNFEIIDSLPKIYNIDELINDTSKTSWLDSNLCVDCDNVQLDCEQGNSNVYDYDYYEIKYVDIAGYHLDDDEDKDIDDYFTNKYIAIKKEEDDEDEE
ncbi:MAG: hypothetical protein RSA24_02975 [Clostridia bacterium]